MSADDVIVDFVAVAQLNLDAPTQWREHLREDELFIPHWLVGSLPYTGPALAGILQTKYNILLICFYRFYCLTSIGQHQAAT